MREVEKRAKEEQKKVRLQSRPEFAKTPRLGSAEPFESRVPRQGGDPASILDMQMQYARDCQDCDGQWSWGLARDCLHSCWDADIAPTMEQLARLTWKEIYAQTTGAGRKKHHSHEVSRICREARDRWAVIGLAEFEEAYRFRLGSKPRLWGFRTGPLFYVVWWDPVHRIYPTEPA